MGRRVRNLLLFLLLLLALGVRLRGIENPLLDDQGWRQADTASMATHMLGHLTDIPSVFLPQLNYDGVTPQRVELEFPFLPYLLAWTWTLFGWADIWGRLWSVALSLVTVIGIYDLGRKMFTDSVGLLAAAIYAVMPLGIYYGRVVMPEPMAQAWSIWALSMAWRWRWTAQEVGSWKAGLLMAGAILAKLPQLMLFPVALLLSFFPWNPQRKDQLVRFCLMALLPPMVYYLWVHFHVASTSQFVSGIVTGNVAGSGNLDWKLLTKNIRLGFTPSALLLSGVGMCRLTFFRSPGRTALLVWGAIGVLYVGSVCVRIPLDYYLVPLLPLVALLSAYALEGIDYRMIWIIIAVLVWINRGSYTYLTPKYHWNQDYLAQAQWIKSYTSNSTILILSDSPPMTFYYAHRVGFRLTIKANRENTLRLVAQYPGDYLVQLPGSQQTEFFWTIVRERYPEIGPGIYDLKNPKK